MPASYSHYRFGVQILPGLPADVRRPIQRYRQLFDMGLQGPDFFFYDLHPKCDSPGLGHRFHYLSGRDFFTPICAALHTDPSEAGLAYLYGLLAHYCLDSHCHPLIHRFSDPDTLLHNEVETEFDRFLLIRDGKPRPHAYDRSIHLAFSREHCSLIAGFYPPATPEQILRGMQSAQRYTKLLTAKNSIHRNLADKVLRALGPEKTGLLMHPAPNPRCAQLNPELLGPYNQALAQFPVYLEQLCSHIAYNAPLGDEFSAIFG